MRRVVRNVSQVVLLAVMLVGCYTPPAYVVPTEVATSTPVPANATAVAALQTGPTATQAAVAAATSIAASSVHITDASFDPGNAADSAVTLSNAGSANVDLGGWVLLVSNYRVTLPTTNYMTVGPGSSLIVHLATSQTPTSGQNVYVGLGSVDNTPRANPDQIVLLNPSGQVASTYAIK
ncbi:MAG TPA: lamin tail domain-containing protein [Chloroflexota bacterium]